MQTSITIKQDAALVIVDDVVLLRTQRGEFTQYEFIGMLALNFDQIRLARLGPEEQPINDQRPLDS